jgi:Leucine-rich repeat (LRR) protein
MKNLTIFYKQLTLAVIVFSSISIKSQNKSRFASTGETVYYSLEIALLHPNRVLFLDLSGAHLIEVPEEIFELTNLIALDLSNNFLTKVPKEIFDDSKLEELYLEGNPSLKDNPKHFLDNQVSRN